jgi:hypothetical protein
VPAAAAAAAAAAATAATIARRTRRAPAAEIVARRSKSRYWEGEGQQSVGHKNKER